MFIIAVILIAASGFFLLRAVTSRRLQVESTLGRIPGYGYGEPIRTNDPRAWLRRVELGRNGVAICWPKSHRAMSDGSIESLAGSMSVTRPAAAHGDRASLTLLRLC